MSIVGKNDSGNVESIGVPVEVPAGDALPARQVEINEPSLDDLIEAYREGGHAGRSRFEILRKKFCDYHQADIEEQYFTRVAGSGVVLLRSRDSVVRWVRFEYERGIADSEFDEVLGALYNEQLQSATLWRGIDQVFLVRRVYAVIANLLSVLDSAKVRQESGGTDEVMSLDAAVVGTKNDLASIREFARLANRRLALRRYLAGFPFGGLFAGLVVAAFVVFPLDIGRDGGSSTLAMCLAAGAVGAIISVMARITGGKQPEIDSDQSKVVTILAGAFRPVVGAVFGAVLYALIAGGLLPIATPGTGQDAGNVGFFFAAIAFLAGFSERWAQDIIVQSAPGTGIGGKRGDQRKEAQKKSAQPESAQPESAQPGKRKVPEP